jgi:hypothetical protein
MVLCALFLSLFFVLQITLSQCFEAAIPVVDDDVIQQLLKETITTAPPNINRIHIEPLVDSKGFCDHILQGLFFLGPITNSISGFEIGEMDTQLGELGLSPQILVSSDLGIFMECLNAPTLTKEDFHSSNDNSNNL